MKIYNIKVEYIIELSHTHCANEYSFTYKTIETRTGNIVGFIPGNDKEIDKFIIVDDNTNRFIKVNINDCRRID